VELFVDNPPDKPGIRTPNQIDEVLTINEIADKVNSIIPNDRMYIESPRCEYTGEFYYNPIRDTIKSLGFSRTRSMEQEIEYCIDKIDVNLIHQIKNLIIPKINWR
jgi:nucleoside-diphosphate-sugar epimerase